jgi:hypothetical protein
MASLIDCKDDVFDLFEQWNFDITSGGEHVTTPTPMGKTFNFFPPGVLPLGTDHYFSLTNLPPTSLLIVILGVCCP